ncbi:lipocalin family protein [Parerythrobacter jejuensis]|uniref:Outer membrane lipoprotein Blc n=1 Tax=Parerythrobacter jejuensis TaxID=795812 RepID=A0A845AVF1_9SPHN|nr:lipocalin family protein [Parerythrobacter jejuensis]MXP30325.1 lipocalin [Parerythrobacter jejuensis]MXP33085.1 lipocalin [Parerythrobacter jejuensis]
MKWFLPPHARWQVLAPLFLLGALGLGGCVGSPGPVGNASVPQPVAPVALESYLGTWYEMARYEAPFQKGCEAVTAEYSTRPDGKIEVVNTCREGSVDGKFRRSTGKAKIVEGSDGAKLKVSFFGPFYGDYWILDRGEPDRSGQYSWSIVGEPSGRFLWILTRQPKPGAALRARLETRVKEMGYDWSLVRPTQH